MAGYEESQPPDPEVFIVDGDQSLPPDSGREAARRPASALRRIGAVLGVTAVFALGVLVGRTSLDNRTDATAPVTTPTAADMPPPTTGQRSPAATAATADITASSTGATGTLSHPATVTAAIAGGQRYAVPSACGRWAMPPHLDGVRPLAATVDLRLIAGGDPAPVNLGTRTVSGALYEPDTTHFVANIAAGRGVLIVHEMPCDGGGPGRIIRIPMGTDTRSSATTATSAAAKIPLPDGTRRVSLIAGGDRVWVAASPGSYGYGPVTLIAADGSGDTATLPESLEPIGAVGPRIIGQYGLGGLSSRSFGVFDTETGKIVTRFGGSGTTAANAVAGGNTVVTAPWVCGASCEVRSYTISTGAERSVRMTPASDALLAGDGAVSPNGLLVAAPLYAQPRSPAPFAPYRLGLDSPHESTRIGLMDLDTGRVRALPGLTLDATASPALAFSPDGRWIVVAVGDGYKIRLLLYTAGGDGPFDPGITVPGLVASPPLAMLPVASR